MSKNPALLDFNNSTSPTILQSEKQSLSRQGHYHRRCDRWVYSDKPHRVALRHHDVVEYSIAEYFIVQYIRFKN